MSSRPNSRTTAATAASIATRSRTSRADAAARPPAARIRAAVASAAAPSRSVQNTAAPSRASASAPAPPMPPPAPATSATLPATRPMPPSCHVVLRFLPRGPEAGATVAVFQVWPGQEARGLREPRAHAALVDPRRDGLSLGRQPGSGSRTGPPPSASLIPRVGQCCHRVVDHRACRSGSASARPMAGPMRGWTVSPPICAAPSALLRPRA